METKHQTLQREATALHAQVIEVVEAMKDCDGIPWFFFDVFCLQILPSADLFSIAWSSSPC
jgi:hypothetical protein